MYGLRKAVHNLVKTKMQAAVVSNDDIRAETNSFNLIAAPGYPELLDEMIALSGDRRNTAFVIGDTIHLDLKQMQQAQKTGQQTPNNASENGEDGLLTFSYAAVYYPKCFSN